MSMIKEENRLTLIEKTGKKQYGHAIGRYKCSCGNEKEICISDVNRGFTKSCGCLHIESIRKRRLKHGCARTPEYNIWANIKTRCLNEKSANYDHYGGRGISICQLWRYSFEEFYRDMGPRPSKLHSIDRIDNNGNYCPNNCKWSTTKEQNRNQRSNNWVKYNGKNQILSYWAEEIGMRESTLHYRLYKLGWTPEKAFTTPLDIVQSRKKRKVLGV